MTEGNRLFSKLQNFVVEEAIARSEEIKFSKDNKLDFSRMALYCSLLEQSWAILVLVHKDLGFHAYPLLRAQLEGYSDFKNLAEDPGYLKHLEYQYEKSKLKQRVAAKRGNPYLRLFSEAFDLDSELSNTGRNVKALEKLGARNVSIEDKFLLAGLKAEYQALYPMLCDHTHGNLRALVCRHVHEAQGEFEVVAFSKGGAEGFEALLQTSYDIALRASHVLHHCLQTEHEEFFADLIHRESGEAVPP